MISIKDLTLLVCAVICFIVSYLIIPYGEQYQGATGYIYEHGWLFAVGNVVLMVIGFLILVKVIVDNYELFSEKK